jgi:hypothetical protein
MAGKAVRLAQRGGIGSWATGGPQQVAAGRRRLLADGRVLVQLKPVWADDTSYLLVGPLEFLEDDEASGPISFDAPGLSQTLRRGRSVNPRRLGADHQPLRLVANDMVCGRWRAQLTTQLAQLSVSANRVEDPDQPRMSG